MINEARMATKNEITAEQVRKQPVGTKVIIHSFDRRGEHTRLQCAVVQSGKHEALAYNDQWGLRTTTRIVRESDRKWYSLG